jgi:hypothetical protein
MSPKLFKCLLRCLIPLWVIRARLQTGQHKFAQPFADRAFAGVDREALYNLLAQIAIAPADDFVQLRVGTGDDQLTQLIHLRVGQFWLRPWCTARHQAISAGLVIAMHPVAQVLPVHPCLPGRLQTRGALKHPRDRQ